MTQSLFDQWTAHFQRLEIFTVQDANAYITVKNRDAKTRIALQKYMLRYSAILVNGKFETVYEFDTVAGTITVAALDESKLPGWAAVTKKRGHRYETAWNEDWARKKFEGYGKLSKVLNQKNGKAI